MICKSKSGLAKNTEIEILIATVFLLMTRYASTQEKELIKPIIEHFNWINNHPNLANPQLKNICTKLSKCWKFMEFGGEITIKDYHNNNYIH
tara:strand:- start:1255 stop:1530 length:276 start_codon:yes stop_codon:yes gene_type:complete